MLHVADPPPAVASAATTFDERSSLACHRNMIINNRTYVCIVPNRTVHMQCLGCARAAPAPRPRPPSFGGLRQASFSVSTASLMPAPMSTSRSSG